MTMRWYAANPDRRTAQVMTDLAVVGWFVLCLWLANGVQSRFDDLADQIRQAETATANISQGLSQAGEFLGGVPLVGDQVREPFDAAAGASDNLGAATLESADRTERAGTWLAVVLVIGLFTPVGIPYGRRRIRKAREAGRIEVLARTEAGVDLLAVRALMSLPAHEVAAAVPDAADGWRRRDPAVMAALVQLQLLDVGLDPASLRPV